MMSRDFREPVNAELIVNGSNITRYKITDKRLKFLEMAEKMNDLIRNSE
jgi:predicted transcriptional regulator